MDGTHHCPTCGHCETECAAKFESAAQDGIDTRENVRAALIEWRDNAMKREQPPWDGIVLLSHAIWWLS